MGFFFNNGVFDENFVLDDKFIFKNTICFDYSNIYNDEFVVQGFCISRDYCMISAYSKKKVNSRVYLYEKNGVFNKFIELDNNSHVGGISYDYINDIIFITGDKGKVNAYQYNELTSGIVKKYKCDIDISEVLDGVVSAATLYFYNNSLYVCTCSEFGRMVEYNIVVDKKNKIIGYHEYSVINDLPACIQGICVCEKNDELYYIFSQSYSKLKSIVKIYDKKCNFRGQKILDFIGIEGIDIDYTGNVVGVSENGIDLVKRIPLCEVSNGIKGTLEKKYIDKGKYHQERLNKMK